MMLRVRLLAALMAIVAGCVDLSAPPSQGVRPDGLAADLPIDRLAEPSPDGPGGDDTTVPDGDRDEGEEPAPDASFSDADVDGETGDADPSDAPIDGPLLAAGAACEGPGECQSNFCSSGICCATACEGDCRACNLPGGEGACLPRPAGNAAAGCQAQPASTCGRDGTCDGQGGCRLHPLATLCAPGSCVGATETAASSCDGQGTCVTGTSRSCAPNVCTNGACASSCTTAADCQAGFFCAGDSCQPKRPPATVCASAVECISGFCVDGVCCGSACAGTCHACNLAGTVGSCWAIADGQDPGTECPAADPTTCGRAGGCNGAGACRLFPAGTVCAPQGCTGSTESAARQCNGTGTCAVATTRDCGAYLCSGAACGSSCSATSQCKTGNACLGNVCQPCTVESNAAFCARLGKSCGSVVGTDNCGGTRAVSCGSCTSPQTCGGGGTANVCGGGMSCGAAYSQGACTGYLVGTTVSSGGRNWRCANGNCQNCATNAGCAPGGSGCPWGVVWTDLGACQ